MNDPIVILNSREKFLHQYFVNFSMQGFAAGLMLSISFFDLAHNAINSIGFLRGNLWVGYIFPFLHQNSNFTAC